MIQTKLFRVFGVGAISLLSGVSALTVAPSPGCAAQFVLFDVTFTYTKMDADTSTPSKSHYYVRGNALNPDRPGDWTSPVDYRNGTVHIRAEVIEKPAGREETTWTLCYIPNRGQGNGYGCTGTGIYREKGVYELDVPMTSFWQNEAIVWSEGIKRMDLVIKDGSGGSGHAHRRPDSEKFFPTKMRITMIQVSAGSTYDPSMVGAKTAASIASSTAEDWPQWRGPSSQGISTETGLPVKWSATENVAWKATLAGFGASSPIVTGGVVIVTSQIGSYASGAAGYPRLARDDQSLAVREHAIGGSRIASGESGRALFLAVEAFRRSDGRRLWEYRTPATGERPENHEKHNLATPTPVTDGERVYAWFGNGQVIALDLEGRELWKRHLGQEYGSFLNDWGHGSSPALYKDLLILLCDHRPVAYLLALDKRTGEQRWKVDRGNDRVSHSTPVVVRGPKGDELIVNSSERIDAFDPDTGNVLWQAGAQRQTPIPSVVSHDGAIYMSRGYRNSDVLAIRAGGRGDVTASHLQWRMPNGASYVPSILQYEGLLYMTNEVGVVTCAEAATGQKLWQKRLGGIFFASPVAGDGKVYMLSETGEAFVLRAGRQPEVLATNDLGERFLASPAISGRRIFLRSDGTLFAVGRVM